MDRIIIGLEGLECVNSDQCMSIRGGSGVWKRIIQFILENADELIEGFIEGWNGEKIIQKTETQTATT